jgi:hypothetical protein
MAWCEENGIDFVFGLPGNAVLADAVEETADDIRTRRALDHNPCLRGFAETRYQAKSWDKQRRACARRCTVSHGAVIAPPIPSQNLQRLPQTPDPSGETDVAHNCAFDCHERIAIRPLPPDE